MSHHSETDERALKVLLQSEHDLSDRLKRLKVDSSKSHSIDSSEQAIERENDEVIDQLEGDTHEELLQVQHAIQRIEQGDYHRCEKCGGEISLERLKIIPSTTLCIHCAEAI